MRRPPGAGFVGLFVRHPNAANLLMVLLVMGGLFSLARMQTQFFPTVEIPIITISVPWSGASAEDVEANIIEAVEQQVRFLDGIKELTSYAREGAATVVIELLPRADKQKALSDVETAVDAITTLPEDAEEPRVSSANWYETVAKFAISGPFSEEALKSFARRMRDELLAAGIERVTLNGVRSEEVWIEAPAQALRRLDLTLGGIGERIAEETRDLPAGTIEGRFERQLRALGEAERPEEFAALPMRTLPTGERIRLGDFARVTTAFDDTEPLAFINGRRAIELDVQRSASADTLKTAAILDDYLARVLPTLPPTLQVVQYDRRSDYLVERINLLIDNGLTGLVLVVVILFVFLNARIAVWVAAGIPVAVMATLALMWMSGQSINMISLFALILTLGIIVDDAIVVGEHTATVYERDDDATAAAERGVMRMLMPVAAATLTTQAAFLPLFLVGDVIGQIMRALPLVVIAVLMASLIESFFILPSHLRHSLDRANRHNWLISLDGVRGGQRTATLLLLATLVLLGLDALVMSWLGADVPGNLVDRALNRMLEGSTAGYGALLALIAGGVLMFVLLILMFEGLGLRQLFDRGFDRFRSGPVRWLAEKAFRWRYVTVATAVAVFAISFGLFVGGFVRFQFFPAPEAESISATVAFGAGTPREQAVAALGRIEDSLAGVERRLGAGEGSLVTAVYTTLGKSGFARDENIAEISVQLTASEAREVRTREIVMAWNRALPKVPGVDRVTITARSGGPPGRDIDVRLAGAPIDVLKQAALELRDIVSRYPGASAVADDLPYGKQELVLELTPRGRALGFTTQSVGSQVRNAFEGAIAKRFARGDDEITVRVMYDGEDRGLGGLDALHLRSPTGNWVPLGEVARLREKTGFSIIQHRQGRRSVAVTGDVDANVTTSQDIVAALDAGPLPELARKYSLDYRFAGREEERANSFADLQLGTLVALGLIYLILAWVFASYTRPFAVMVIVPFGVVGAIVGHWLMGFALSVMSFMALLGLAGILVNDSIILVSRLDERLAGGETLEEAAVGAAQDRLRAVLLTSLTTIGGLLPLMFEKSLQAQFLLPMGATLVFGLGVATLLVLFLVPAVVGIGADLRHAFALVFVGRRGRAAAAE